MNTRILAIGTLVAALAGFGFASVATYDFAAHLDRQVHGIHCSFVPGTESTTTDTSGCQTTMMSPYSSVLRQSIWGGVPVSLPGMGLFAFLAFYAIFLLATGAHIRATHTRLSLLFWAVPLLTSLVMGYLALVELDAVCKLCIGIYSSSFVGLIFAALLHSKAKRLVATADVTTTGADQTLVSAPLVATSKTPYFAIAIVAVFVFVPIGTYVAAMPDYSAYNAGCGELTTTADPNNVLVRLSSGPREAIEVLDPLCSSCRAFERRLEASGLGEQLGRRALLFPLESECNWMVTGATHPGACSVSEAILCEPALGRDILEWAFAHQTEIMEAEKARRGAAARMVTTRFPSTRGCVGTTRARTKVHMSLRFAVANELPVLTPQLFVDGHKLCNEDTDLGLEYSLAHLLARPGAQR